MWSCPEKSGGKTSLRLIPAYLRAVPNFLTNTTRADSAEFVDAIFFGQAVVANRNEPVKWVTGFIPERLPLLVFLDALVTETFSPQFQRKRQLSFSGSAAAPCRRALANL